MHLLFGLKPELESMVYFETFGHVGWHHLSTSVTGCIFSLLKQKFYVLIKIKTHKKSAFLAMYIRFTYL